MKRVVRIADREHVYASNVTVESSDRLGLVADAFAKERKVDLEDTLKGIFILQTYGDEVRYHREDTFDSAGIKEGALLELVEVSVKEAGKITRGHHVAPLPTPEPEPKPQPVKKKEDGAKVLAFTGADEDLDLDAAPTDKLKVLGGLIAEISEELARIKEVTDRSEAVAEAADRLFIKLAETFGEEAPVLAEIKDALDEWKQLARRDEEVA